MSTATVMQTQIQNDFLHKSSLIANLMPLCSFSHPISFGTNFALISRVELVFLSTSLVHISPLSREDATLRPNEKKYKNSWERRRNEPFPFLRDGGSESKLEIYRD